MKRSPLIGAVTYSSNPQMFLQVTGWRTFHGVLWASFEYSDNLISILTSAAAIIILPLSAVVTSYVFFSKT